MSFNLRLSAFISGSFFAYAIAYIDGVPSISAEYRTSWVANPCDIGLPNFTGEPPVPQNRKASGVVILIRVRVPASEDSQQQSDFEMDAPNPKSQPLNFSFKEEPPRGAPTLRWWIVVAALFLATFVLWIFISGGSSPGRQMAFRVKCASNLRQIGYAIQMYANGNGGRYPDRLEDLLVENIDVEPQLFVCPSSTDTPATAPTTQQSAARLASEPGHLSYIYVGKGLTNNAAADVLADVLVAYEPLGHHGDGCNMLFADGHVEFVQSSRAKTLISQAATRPTTAATRP